MTQRFGPALIPGRSVYGGVGGLGYPGAQIPTVGSAGPSVIAPFVSLPTDAAVEFLSVLQTAPTGLTSFVLEGDGTFSATGADGPYAFSWELRRDGVSQGIKTTSIQIGVATQAPALPTITTQPVNQSVTAGQTATFSVVATGGPLTQQWRKGGTPIAGATGASYTTPATSVSDSGSTFDVVVSNASGGSVTSVAVSLTVAAVAPGPSPGPSPAPSPGPTPSPAPTQSSPTMTTRLQQRSDTAANFATGNIVLFLGEVGYETDTKRRKTGDGATAWNSLAYDPYLIDAGTFTLGAGSTAITHAAHANRVGNVAQSGATTAAFLNAAASGAAARDSVYIRNEGAGTLTATGAITAPTGYTLVAGPGVVLSADYSAVADAWVSTTVSPVLASPNPTMSWSVPASAPNTIEGVPSEPMYRGSTPAVGAFTVTKAGTAWGVSGFAWNSTTKAILTMASSAAVSENILLSFDEGAGPRLLSQAHNKPVAVITAAQVTNNATGATGSPLSIAGSPVTSGASNGSYAGFTATASGGTSPYSYALNTAGVSANLTVNISTGAVVSSALAAPGTYAVAVIVTDAVGATASLPFSLVVGAAGPTPVRSLSESQVDQIKMGADWGSNYGSNFPPSYAKMGVVGVLPAAGELQMTYTGAGSAGTLGIGTKNLFNQGGGNINCECAVLLEGDATISAFTTNATKTSNLATLSVGHIVSIGRDSSNVVTIKVSTNGGTSWTTVFTFSGTLTGSVNAYVGQSPDWTCFVRAPKSIGVTVAIPAPIGMPVANRSYQRVTTTGGGAGKGQGAITVEINHTASNPVWARTRTVDGTTVLQAPFQVSASAAAGLLTIPGVDARPASFYFDVGPSASGPWTSSPTPIQMGRIIALGGQSLADAMFHPYFSASLSSVGVTPSPTSRVFASYASAAGQPYVTPQWLQPADGTIYGGAGVAELLRLQEIASGVACAAIGAPVGGTPIANYIPGGAGNGVQRSVLDAAGGHEAVIFFIGHTDAATATNERDFRSRIGQVFDDHAAHNVARGAVVDKVFLTMPNIALNSWGDAESRRTIRNAGWQWADDNGATFVAPCDISLGDGVHEDQVGAVTLARHMHRALRPGLGLTGGDNGPKVTSATRSGVTITLNVSLPTGATAMTSTGSPAQRFSVFAAGTTTTALAFDATTPITIGTNTITLKLAADPGGPVDVHVLYSKTESGYDGAANCIWDNHTDGDGITRGRQLMPTRAPVSTDGVVNLTKVGVDQTMSGATYAAGASGFGQKVTAGQVTIPNTVSGGMPLTNSWTWEAFLEHAATQIGNEWFGTWGGCFDLRATDDGKSLRLLMNNTAGATLFVAATPIINDGARHHVRVVSTPARAYLYCDGALCGSLAMTPAFGQGQSTAIGGHGDAYYQWNGSFDELAFWTTAKSTGSTYTVPSAPYVGTEPNLCGLWHFDGNGVAATRTAVV